MLADDEHDSIVVKVVLAAAIQRRIAQIARTAFLHGLLAGVLISGAVAWVASYA